MYPCVPWHMEVRMSSSSHYHVGPGIELRLPDLAASTFLPVESSCWPHSSRRKFLPPPFYIWQQQSSVYFWCQKNYSKIQWWWTVMRRKTITVAVKWNNWKSINRQILLRRPLNIHNCNDYITHILKLNHSTFVALQWK